MNINSKSKQATKDTVSENKYTRTQFALKYDLENSIGDTNLLGKSIQHSSRYGGGVRSHDILGCFRLLPVILIPETCNTFN
jgi:hypothetical protein